MYRSGLIAITLVLAACTVTATPEQERIGAQAEPKIERLGKIDIVDQRPASEKKTHTLGLVAMVRDVPSGETSGAAFGCSGGVSVLGEEPGNGAPDRIARLERDLHQAFGARIEGQTVTVLSYGVFANSTAGIVAADRDEFTRTAKDAVTIKPKCDRDHMAGGWYDPADLDNNFSPVTADIKVRFRDKEYSVTAAQSPPIYQYFNQWVLPVVAQGAMRKAHGRLIAAIRQDWLEAS